MKLKTVRETIIAMMVLGLLMSCSPQKTSENDALVNTAVALQVAELLTQTAGAVTSTPPLPSETPTPLFTETPAVPTEKPVLSPPSVTVFAPCYKGPGSNYTLISNIDPSIRKKGRQVVTILGIGSVPGWYIIRNPYFNNPCWIQTEFVEVDPLMDMTQFPVMTPPPP